MPNSKLGIKLYFPNEEWFVDCKPPSRNKMNHSVSEKNVSTLIVKQRRSQAKQSKIAYRFEYDITLTRLINS